MAVKCQNQHDGSWMVYETKSGRTAYIHRISEMNFGSHGYVGYRVDFQGRTVASALDHFQTAKGIATKHVKGEA